VLRLLSTPGLAVVWHRYLKDYEKAQAVKPSVEATVVPEVWAPKD
jgi:hypothetical protein